MVRIDFHSISFLFVLCVLLSLNACSSNTPVTQKHVFYLHGRIIELQGINAVSPDFGPYRYTEIIDSLSSAHTTVYHTVRSAGVDFSSFCERISKSIDSLLEQGVLPEQITVIGASKGAVMAMQISHLNPAPIQYVLLGANNANLESEQDWTLHGHILGIYESSDQLAGRNYDHWIKQSADALTFEQLEISTGLGHGFLYRPYDAWLKPARKWIQNGTVN